MARVYLIRKIDDLSVKLRGEKTMKKKLSFLGIAVCLLVVSIIGGSIAYFRADSDARNIISAGNLGVELQLDEGVDKQHVRNNGLLTSGALPGTEIAYPVFAHNNGDYDSYIRVTLTRYWEDRQGDKNFDADASMINLVMNNKEEWIIDDTDENQEVVYLYYRKPVTSGMSTGHVVDAIQIGNISSSEQSLYSGLQAKVDIEVNAIQKAAAQDAMLAEWGMDVEFDDNGNIVSVVE